MVTNQNALTVITQISKIFCAANLVCQSNVKNRMVNYLTNDLVNLILANLNLGRFYIFKIDAVIPSGANYVDLKTSYTDLITGATGAGLIRSVPLLDYMNKDYYKIFQKSNLDYLDMVNVAGVSYQIVQNKYVEGYNIVYVAPTGGGSTTGGGSNTTGTGQILVKHNEIPAVPVQTNLTPTQTTPTQKLNVAGFDVTGLLIPGVIILGLYLLVK
jgi:hypothetical protein